MTRGKETVQYSPGLVKLFIVLRYFYSFWDLQPWDQGGHLDRAGETE